MSQHLKDPKNYFNRELSWLKFNERVLEEAVDSSHPLLERIKFISIFSSNLDEFFMIRVAGLKEQTLSEINDPQIDGIPPKELLLKISDEVHRMVEDQIRLLSEGLIPELRHHDIRLRKYSTLSKSQKAALSKYFDEKLFPIITPLAVDPSHPFPELRSLAINLLVELRPPLKRNEKKIAVVPVPGSVSRFIEVPSREGWDFILLEELILEYLDRLFPNMKILSVSQFRVTRNADMDLSDAEADDLLKMIETELRKRRLGSVIRLEISDKMSGDNRKLLKETTELEDWEIYEHPGFLDIASFMALHQVDVPEIKDKPFTPALNPDFFSSEDVFSLLRKKDILLYHPYDSFSHVVEFIQTSANDPRVLAIKQTLYRTSGRSPIAQALKEAAGNGKQVTALIELKARFDEETNIGWAKELEKSGVYVVYGLLGLKTHCKLCMIIRQDEDDIIRAYTHVSTGNYNVKTTKIYTDFGLFTSDSEMGKDFSDLFNLLTGYSGQTKWRKILVAPVNLREELTKHFHSAIKRHSPAHPSRIRMVMNALVDPDMIQQLYKTSQRGIKVELVVRGICCLRPGIKGLSENISVRSIVGRFLEHSRVFSFEYGNNRFVFLGSADLMPRNLNRRVELMIPIENPGIQDEVMKTVDLLLRDTVKARELKSDGNYQRVKPKPGESPVNCQEMLLEKKRVKE